MSINVLSEKISNAELEVLKVLWKAGREMTITEIRSALSSEKGWEASTIKTLVYRLCEKGALISEKRGVFYYSCAVSEKEYNDYATQNVIDKLYGGSAKNLIASLIDGRKLSGGDIAELRKMFEAGDFE